MTATYANEKDWKHIDIQEALADLANLDIRQPSYFYDDVIARRDKVDNGIKLPWGSLEDKLFFRESEVILIAGRSGHGKSSQTNHICHHAMTNGHKVGIASLELQAADLMEQFAEFSYAGQRPPAEYVKKYLDWADSRLLVYDVVDTIEPQDAIRMCIRMAQLGCELIVLDCLMMMNLSDDVRSNEHRVERDFMATLNAIAKKFNVAIALVHHVRKAGAGDRESTVPSMSDLLGSSMLSNMASTVIIFYMDMEQLESRMLDASRRPEDFDDNKRDALLKVVKQRNNMWRGAIQLWRCRDHRAFVDGSIRVNGKWVVDTPKFAGRTRARQKFPPELGLV
tara:strand:- start:154 stop:1167 length:1014 start_codon:yes stop_codon:yes gene_type:complete